VQHFMPPPRAPDSVFNMITLRRLHRTTAALIALFATVHIVNHLVALAGVPMHLAFMKAAF
jgi:hypothetical protein